MRSASGEPTPAAWLRIRFCCSRSSFEVELRVVDPHVGQVAEAGVDAVDRGTVGDRILDDLARGPNSRGDPRREATARAVGDPLDLFERHSLAVDGDRPPRGVARLASSR